MKVFLSWSGDKSRAAAEALRDWLPSVINEIEPFVSAKDIAAGARWQGELSVELDATNFGIVCVTKENQLEPWLNFEAGALAKAVGASLVVPVAIDLGVADIKLPLGQFQAQPLSKDGVLEVARSVNSQVSKPLPDERLRDACDVWWPRLESRVAEIDEMTASTDPGLTRTDRDLLEEILTTVRGLHTQQGVDDATLWARTVDQPIRAPFRLAESALRANVADAYNKFRRIRDLLPNAEVNLASTHPGQVAIEVETSDPPSGELRAHVAQLAQEGGFELFIHSPPTSNSPARDELP